MFTAISTPTPSYRCGDSVIIVILMLIRITKSELLMGKQAFRCQFDESPAVKIVVSRIV
jgi:hypothetical protein